jgi:mannose-6-phosphate isomerase-like protein (cupin superfamily)
VSPNGEGIVRVPLEGVPQRDLRDGVWSRLSLSDETLQGNNACLGYATFPPGSVTQFVVHDTEELFFIVEGTGELHREGAAIPFGPRDAFFVPAGAWHAVANTGATDVVTVFGFPTPNYPRTEQREPPGE